MVISIAGVGALGSHLVQFIRCVPAKIKVIDFDKVEQKNCLSQYHPKQSIGKNKALALKQSMEFLHGIKIEAVPHKIVESNTAILAGDLIVDCLDNPEARILVRDYARKTNTPLLHGALSGDGHYGVVAWDSRFSIDTGTKGQQATCEDGAHLPFIAMVSGLLARSVQEYVDSRKEMSYHVFSKSPAIQI